MAFLFSFLCIFISMWQDTYKKTSKRTSHMLKSKFGFQTNWMNFLLKRLKPFLSFRKLTRRRRRHKNILKRAFLGIYMHIIYEVVIVPINVDFSLAVLDFISSSKNDKRKGCWIVVRRLVYEGDYVN